MTKPTNTETATTYAERVWAAVAADGYRYEDGFMVLDGRCMPVPPRERKAARNASRKAEAQNTCDCGCGSTQQHQTYCDDFETL